MRALSICLGLALSLGWFISPSNANITIPKTNSDVQTFNGGVNPVGTNFVASGSKSVTFSPMDFNNHPTADIISIEVAISFTKQRDPDPVGVSPFFNEIRMTFGKPAAPELPMTTLINNGPALPPFNPDNTQFQQGPFSGFDGTVTFRSAYVGNNPATTPVNSDPTNIPGTGKFLPAGPTTVPPPTWETFLGKSAYGTYTLNLSDNDAAGDGSFDPLVFRSMTVTITAVPEPSSFAAFGLLAVGGTFIRRRRARG